LTSSRYLFKTVEWSVSNTISQVEINASVTFSIDYMQKAAEKQQQELLELITTLSDDRVSSVQNFNRVQYQSNEI
jgi:hypothetical protein